MTNIPDPVFLQTFKVTHGTSFPEYFWLQLVNQFGKVEKVYCSGT